MADSPGLARETAAEYIYFYVEFCGCAGKFEGLANDELEGLHTEIIVYAPFIDDDIALAGQQVHPCHRTFAPARTVIHRCCHINLLIVYNLLNRVTPFRRPTLPVFGPHACGWGRCTQKTS
jgi:hypothetical protein